MSVTPYYSEDGITIYHSDCREVLPTLGVVDCVIADPPYGQTSLRWDRWMADWLELLPSKSFWCFGTLRMFMDHAGEFAKAGWQMSQDLVWEKHNGSSSHSDRFRRIHEQIAYFYKGRWADIPRTPVYTYDASARSIMRQSKPAHMGRMKTASSYESIQGGPRLQRSVIKVRSCHGSALHETQKPLGIIDPLLEYSCPVGGVVLDPFAGSGTTGVAAKALGLRAILIEVREECCEIAVERLRQGSLLAADQCRCRPYTPRDCPIHDEY